MSDLSQLYIDQVNLVNLHVEGSYSVNLTVTDYDNNSLYTFPQTAPPVNNSIQSFNTNGTSQWISGGSGSLVPSGGIIMFTGLTAPSGWSLCDGTNGTPDLRNMFIVSQGNNFPINTTGGALQATLLPENLPPHFHVTYANQINVSGGGGTTNTVATSTGDQNGLTDFGPGTSTAFDILPPYYSLAYIMKL